MRPMQADVVACLRGRSGLIRVGVVVVGASGNVRDASIASTEFATEITEVERECVLNTVRGLTFPHFTRETTSFEYPYQIAAP